MSKNTNALVATASLTIGGISSTSVSEIMKALGLIKKSGEKLQKLIHTTAVQALMHAYLHGDVSPAQAVYNVMPFGELKGYLRIWFGAMGPITARKDKGVEVWKMKDGWTQDQFKLEEAAKTPFWVYGGGIKLPKVFSGLGFLNTVAGAIKRMEDAIKKQNEDGVPHFAGDAAKTREFLGAVIDFAQERAKRFAATDLGATPATNQPENANVTATLTKAETPATPTARIVTGVEREAVAADLGLVERPQQAIAA